MNCSKTNFLKASITGILISMLLALPQTVSAEEVTCTVVYGQGEVCGVSTTEEVIHTPVEAGVGDIKFASIALFMSATGAALYLISQITKKFYILDR